MNRRAVYDTFGYDVLRKGLNLNGLQTPAYHFDKENTNEVFHQFIKSSNIFTNIIDFNGTQIDGSMFGGAFSGLNCKYDYTPWHLSLTLQCTIRELYFGCVKEI